MKKIRFVALLFTIVLCVGCVSAPSVVETPFMTVTPLPTVMPTVKLTPTPVPTPVPKPEPVYDAQGRRKLWDDDVYVTVPVKSRFTYIQQVYNNYGDIVAQYTSLYDEDGIAHLRINEKTDIEYCYAGENKDLKIFSYEEMGYVKENDIRQDSHQKYSYEINSDEEILTVLSGGKEYICILPEHEECISIKSINDSMVLIENQGEGVMQDILIQYKIDKDVSYLLDGWEGAYLSEGNVTFYKLNDDILTILSNEQTYTYHLSSSYDDDEYQIWIDDSMVFIQSWPYVQKLSKLILYKDGKDISYFLKVEDEEANGYKCSGVDFLDNNEALITNPWENMSIILDSNGNMLSQNPGLINYIGHDLYSTTRGNYQGVMNAYGEWLIRSLCIDAD